MALRHERRLERIAFRCLPVLGVLTIVGWIVWCSLWFLMNSEVLRGYWIGRTCCGCMCPPFFGFEELLRFGVVLPWMAVVMTLRWASNRPMATSSLPPALGAYRTSWQHAPRRHQATLPAWLVALWSAVGLVFLTFAVQGQPLLLAPVDDRCHPAVNLNCVAAACLGLACLAVGARLNRRRDKRERIAG